MKRLVFESSAEFGFDHGLPEERYNHAMKRFVPPQSAPESWKASFRFDELEVYGRSPRSGYARAYAERRRQTLSLLEKFLPPPASILDIAAAQGNFSLTLAEAGYRVTWNDLRAELAEYVEQKRARGTVSYLPGNAFELPHATRYDAVLITEVIEHVAHPDAFLRKAASLVAPGGIVVMSTPNGGYFRNRLPRFSECADPSQFESVQFKPDADGHIFLLHVDELEDLAHRAGLRIEELRLFNNSLTSGALGTRFVLPYLPDVAVRVAESVTSKLPSSLGRKLNMGLAAVLRVGPS